MTTEDEAEQARRLEFGRWLFAQECEFVFGATTVDSLLTPDLPEVAFAGRSNVGKSSLVNALTGRKTLARVSQTPGRTQQINFFNLAGQLGLVDLPGYGYNRAGKTVAATWGQAVRVFLKGRPSLRRVCLLIDSRHGPNRYDIDTMDALDQSAVNYQVVLTKVDKVKPNELKRVTAGLQKELATHIAAHPVIMATSAQEGIGIPELRAELAALAAGSTFR